MKHRCITCNHLSSTTYVFLQIAKCVYMSLHCKKHTQVQINELPISAFLTGETVRIVKWRKDHWEDERGEVMKEI